MKVTKRCSLNLTLSTILELLRRHPNAQNQVPYSARGSGTENVRAEVTGDGQTAVVTDDNPLVLSWDEEVEL